MDEKLVRVATPKEMAENNYHAADLIQEELLKEQPDLSVINTLAWGIKHRTHGIVHSLENEQEHEKDLIALMQEIEGWKAANRLFNVRIEVLKEALKTISEESDDQGARDCAKNALDGLE